MAKSKNRSRRDSSSIIIEPPVLWPMWARRILRQITWRNALLVLGFVAGIVIAQNMPRIRKWFLKAAVGQVTVSVIPASATFPPGQSFQIWINASDPVGFVRLDIAYDPTKITLSQNPTIFASQFTRVVRLTPATEANMTGHIMIIAGVSSVQNSAPAGSFRFATLPFTPVSATPNDKTSVQIIAGNSELVDMSAVPFTVTTESSSVVLNVLTTPAATPVPSVTPSPVPTAKPGISVMITSPNNGTAVPSRGSFSVSSSAVSTAGVQTIDLYLNSKLLKECSRKTTCNTNTSLNTYASGTYVIIAKAKSRSGATATTSVKVTKK